MPERKAAHTHRTESKTFKPIYSTTNTLSTQTCLFLHSFIRDEDSRKITTSTVESRVEKFASAHMKWLFFPSLSNRIKCCHVLVIISLSLQFFSTPFFGGIIKISCIIETKKCSNENESNIYSPLLEYSFTDSLSLGVCAQNSNQYQLLLCYSTLY